MNLRTLLFVLCCTCWLSPVLAADPVETAARKAWTITDVVLDSQIDAPARQELLLAGARSLYGLTKQAPPADLGRRFSTVTTLEELTPLLRDAWPKEHKDAEALFLEAVVQRAPGRLVTEAERRVTEQMTSNRYVGTGIQVRLDPTTKLMQIAIPFRGGPAHKAGIKPGDLVLEVDGKSTKGENLGQTVERIRGDEGTEVTLTVRQPGSEEKRDVKMMRGVVPFEHVVGYRPGKKEPWEFRIRADEPIGYVRIKSITSSIAHELREAERQLKGEGVRAVVLDLRYSFGQRMQHAAVAADALLDGGLLWRVRDRANRVREYKSGSRLSAACDVPMAVLIDSTTAGEAVPLLAAALQDNKRAILVGDVSGFGGHVAGLVEVPDGHGFLSLRTGAVEPARPKEEESEEGAAPVMGWRVRPDVRVGTSRKEIDDVIEWFQDKDLLEPKRSESPPKDAPLTQAIEVLREKLKAMKSN